MLDKAGSRREKAGVQAYAMLATGIVVALAAVVMGVLYLRSDGTSLLLALSSPSLLAVAWAMFFIGTVLAKSPRAVKWINLVVACLWAACTVVLLVHHPGHYWP